MAQMEEFVFDGRQLHGPYGNKSIFELTFTNSYLPSYFEGVEFNFFDDIINLDFPGFDKESKCFNILLENSTFNYQSFINSNSLGNYSYFGMGYDQKNKRVLFTIQNIHYKELNFLEKNGKTYLSPETFESNNFIDRWDFEPNYSIVNGDTVAPGSFTYLHRSPDHKQTAYFIGTDIKQHAFIKSEGRESYYYDYYLEISSAEGTNRSGPFIGNRGNELLHLKICNFPKFNKDGSFTYIYTKKTDTSDSKESKELCFVNDGKELLTFNQIEDIRAFIMADAFPVLKNNELYVVYNNQLNGPLPFHTDAYKLYVNENIDTNICPLIFDNDGKATLYWLNKVESEWHLYNSKGLNLKITSAENKELNDYDELVINVNESLTDGKSLNGFTFEPFDPEKHKPQYYYYNH